MELFSTAFTHKGMIPTLYTCHGQNISPELHWTGAPDMAVSLLLICDDPDATTGTWTHWMVYNLPKNIFMIEEGVLELPQGAQMGTNSWGNNNYGGPCPPEGQHHYRFRLFALDQMIDVPYNITEEALLGMIQGHILATAELIGIYGRH